LVSLETHVLHSGVEEHARQVITKRFIVWIVADKFLISGNLALQTAQVFEPSFYFLDRIEVATKHPGKSLLNFGRVAPLGDKAFENLDGFLKVRHPCRILVAHPVYDLSNAEMRRRQIRQHQRIIAALTEELLIGAERGLQQFLAEIL